MSKQPHIYTMPEQFMKDVDVPVRWRIYGVLTGFWITGKTVYATNEWLEKQLGMSKRAIQYGLADLERLNLIKRNVKGLNRIILPGGCNHLHGGVQLDDQKGCNQLHHNSDSNSDSIKKTSKEVFTLEVVPDKPIKRERVDRSHPAFALREKLYQMFKDEWGQPCTPHQGDYFAVLRALKQLNGNQVQDLVEEALESKNTPRTVREALTARKIDIYKQDNL